MTLKEMLNQVLSETGFGEYTEFFSSPRPDAKQMVGLAQREINDLSKHDWQALIETEEVAMTAATEYSLPADFRHFVGDTAFSATRRAMFPTTPEKWAYYDARDINSGIMLRVRLISGALHIQNPNNGGTLRLEYVSNYPVLASDGTTRKQRFSADSDTIVLNDDLFMLGVLWRFRRAKGMDWQPLLGEYNQMKRREMGTDKGSRTVSMAGDEGHPLPEPQADLYL